jgi:antitoxin YefM
MAVMKTVTVTEAKARLNELVDDAARMHEQVVITKHGHPSVVLVAADDLESLKETVYWLSRPDIHATVAEARDDIAARRTISTGELSAELGLASD